MSRHPHAAPRSEPHRVPDHTRREFVRAVGAGSLAASASGLGTATAAQDGADLPAPEHLTVVTRLDTGLLLEWNGVEPADSYELEVERLDGEGEPVTGATGSTGHFLNGLAPATTYVVSVRATDADRASDWTSLTVETAPSYVRYPVSVDHRVDPERTDDEGRPGIVLELTGLPADAAVEHFALDVADADGERGLVEDVAPLEEDVDELPGPDLVVTHAIWEDDGLAGSAGTSSMRVYGSALGSAPTAESEPVELATVWHHDVADADAEVPLEIDVETLVGVEGDEGKPDAPWSIREEGVEEWHFWTEEVSAEEHVREPEVTVDGDRIVVSGTAEFPRTGCDGLAPRRVMYSDYLDRLGVIVDEFERHEVDPTLDADEMGCAQALQYVAYELEVVPDDAPESVIVEERYDDRERSVHYVEGEPGPDVGSAVETYDLTVEEATDDHAVEEPPSVAFEDDRLVVEGTVARGACSVVEVERLAYDAARHDFEAAVATAPREDLMPGQPCPAAVYHEDYRLEVEFAGDELPPHVTAVENGERTATLAHPERGPTLREVAGYEWDAEWELTHDGEQGVEVAFDGDEVTIRGREQFPNAACRALVPTRITFAESVRSYGEETDRLGVVLQEAQAVDACLEAAGTLVYELTAQVPAGADSAVVGRDRGVDDEYDPQRDVFFADGDPGIEPPAGVADYELVVGEPRSDAPRDTSVTFEPGAVVVTGYTTIGSSTCGSLRLDALEWTDGELSVDVVQTTRRDLFPYEVCTDDVASAPYELRLSLESDRPQVVTVAEQGEEQVSVARDACGDASGETVDGQTVCDLDGDGLYRDVTGDGALGQDDVVHFFENQHREAWQDPDLFDFSENGDVGHGDVVALFEHVALD